MLLSLGSAATFGAADFLGGLASRRAAVLHVTLLSQAVGLIVLFGAMPFFPGVLSGPALAWGAVAGVGGAVGLITYFRALSAGAMGVTAPVASLVGAAVPVAVSIGLGERPALTAAIGIVVGIAATVLVSRPAGETDAESRPGVRRGIIMAASAGLLFGVFFVALAQAPEASGLWPLVAARGVGLALLGGAIAMQRPARPDGAAVRIATVSGLLDMTANVLFLLATRQGLLVLTSVITRPVPGRGRAPRVAGAQGAPGIGPGGRHRPGTGRRCADRRVSRPSAGVMWAPAPTPGRTNRPSQR
jgi:uncharacterized membrane protein